MCALKSDSSHIVWCMACHIYNIVLICFQDQPKHKPQCFMLYICGKAIDTVNKSFVKHQLFKNQYSMNSVVQIQTVDISVVNVDLYPFITMVDVSSYFFVT